jgi:hypothetical protein
MKIVVEAALRAGGANADSLSRAIAEIRVDGHRGAALGFDSCTHALQLFR